MEKELSNEEMKAFLILVGWQYVRTAYYNIPNKEYWFENLKAFEAGRVYSISDAYNYLVKGVDSEVNFW